MTRSKYLLVSGVFLLFQVGVSLGVLRWLIFSHFVEYLRAVALTSLVGSTALVLGIWVVGYRRSTPAKRWVIVSWTLPALMVAVLLGYTAYLRLARPPSHLAGTISSTGRLVDTVDWLDSYNKPFGQLPAFLQDTETKKRFRIGLIANGSHTPWLSSFVFDTDGCRAYWLRLQSNMTNIARLFQYWGSFASYSRRDTGR